MPQIPYFTSTRQSARADGLSPSGDISEAIARFCGVAKSQYSATLFAIRRTSTLARLAILALGRGLPVIMRT